MQNFAQLFTVNQNKRMDGMVKENEQDVAVNAAPVAAPADASGVVAAPPAAETAMDAPAAEQAAETAPATESPTQDAVSPKLAVALRALHAIEQQLANVVRLIEEETGMRVPRAADLSVASTRNTGEFRERVHAPFELSASHPSDHRIVEGVFDGYRMMGGDGKGYSVPPNYASKSKMVEGDMLKLTITPKGTFIYKQIGPIERQRIVAALGFDQGLGEYFATHGTRKWNLIKASVTYFRGEPGDEVVLLAPKSTPSKWAAVENIIKKDVMGSDHGGLL